MLCALHWSRATYPSQVGAGGWVSRGSFLLDSKNSETPSPACTPSPSYSFPSLLMGRQLHFLEGLPLGRGFSPLKERESSSPAQSPPLGSDSPDLRKFSLFLTRFLPAMVLALFRTQQAHISPPGLTFNLSGSVSHRPHPTQPDMSSRSSESRLCYRKVAILLWPLLGREVAFVLAWP